MIKTAIKSGWRAVTGWFSAMQDLSYSKASNEVGHLPTPDGIGGTWYEARFSYAMEHPYYLELNGISV